MGTTKSVADTEGQVVALVLAAGGSARLGQPKQLVAAGGESLLRRTARTVLAAPFQRVIVVVGCEAERIGAVVQDLPIALVINEEWQSGMASSVRCGVAAAQEQGADAVLILPCDLPRLSAAHLTALLQRHQGGSPPVATSWRDADGNPAFGAPALFERRYFPALLALQGDEGARKLLRLHRGELSTIEFQDATHDVDTPDDLSGLAAL